MRVVIADDSALLREGLARLLAETGIEVTATVGDADALEEYLAGQEVDVAIIDIRMPPTYTHEGAEAAVRQLPLKSGIVVDLGGGSLQVTEVRRGLLGVGNCVPLGATRLTERFLEHDPPSEAEVARLRRTVRTTLHQSLPDNLRADTMLVLGGTARALARGRRSHGMLNGKSKPNTSTILRMRRLAQERQVE